MDDWLEKLKPGDEVLRHHGINGIDVASVYRVTKTQIIVQMTTATGSTYEQKFSKVSGRLIGREGYHKPFLSQATPERIEAIITKKHKTTLAYSLKDFNWQKMSLEDLDAVSAIVGKYKGSNDNP